MAEEVELTIDPFGDDGNCEGRKLQLVDRQLPTGTAWLDHLDVLGAMRVLMLGNMKLFSQYYAPLLNGYACIGTNVDSDNYKKAPEVLENAHINGDFFVPNKCLEGYVRLEIRNESSIEDFALNMGLKSVSLADDQKDANKQVWKLYSTDSDLKQQATANLLKLWDGFESLYKVRLWWEAIPNVIQITRAGQTLAHTNAKRCNPNTGFNLSNMGYLTKRMMTILGKLGIKGPRCVFIDFRVKQKSTKPCLGNIPEPL